MSGPSLTDANSILVGTVAGLIGSGYLWYGKKQRKPAPMVCGALLIICTYTTDNPWVLLLGGVALCVAPWFFRD